MQSIRRLKIKEETKNESRKQLRYDKTKLSSYQNFEKQKFKRKLAIKHFTGEHSVKRQNKLVIIALLFSALLLSPFVLSLSAATTTIGQTTAGNNSAWQPGGVIVGSKFTATGGTPLSMSVYITQPSSSSNVAKCAIYSESNKQLIAVTEEKIITAGFNGWLTFNFGS